jgi:hypothetical protein
LTTLLINRIKHGAENLALHFLVSGTWPDDSVLLSIGWWPLFDDRPAILNVKPLNGVIAWLIRQNDNARRSPIGSAARANDLTDFYTGNTLTTAGRANE